MSANSPQRTFGSTFADPSACSTIRSPYRRGREASVERRGRV